eukprot:CAMPEP_0172728040 /NCGR_PEP_ID=MMETSP1074-20121228/92020_1 /TAXON_ID=2916 /ORGANISM="Ceratium fusus, Strain PA161109" /LENGTH=101 /DNA_ID=CAMNT_0013555253 /DNA_START=109 /DNA_END=411 /DNA_ORIENTATION=-
MPTNASVLQLWLWHDGWPETSRYLVTGRGGKQQRQQQQPHQHRQQAAAGTSTGNRQQPAPKNRLQALKAARQQQQQFEIWQLPYLMRVSADRTSFQPLAPW